MCIYIYTLSSYIRPSFPQASPHALLLRDERALTPAGMAKREGFDGLHHALERLEGSKVVCVRVSVEMSAHGGVNPAAGAKARGSRSGGGPRLGG